MTEKVIAVPLIASLAMASACTTPEKAAETAATAPAAVTVTATDYAFQAPDTIEAGLTTFHLVNDGSLLHMAQLIRLDSSRTLDEFLVAYEEAFRTRGPRPEWATRIGGPGAAEAHGRANATHQLEPGNYAWICLMNVPDGIPHVVKAKMARPFTVRPRSPEAAPQAAPEASATIQLVEYGFRTSAPLTAGRHTIRVENAGAEPHEVALLKFAAGKTMQDFEAWMQNPQGPPPATAEGGVSSFAGSRDGYFEVVLTPGDYALLCFVTAPDGRPHTEHGMIQHIRIN